MSKSKKSNRPLATYGFSMGIAALVGLAPAALTYSVDPYEMFANNHLEKAYSERAEKAHYPLWKFTHFDGKAETVILGDSRARALRNKYWHELGATKAYNFAYGGGTIPEIYATFQQLRKNPNVKNLVVGAQLRSFDENFKAGMNRVPEAIRATASKPSYLKNWFVARKSWEFFTSQNEATIKAASDYLPTIISNADAAELGYPGTTGMDTLLLPEVCFGCDLPDAEAEYVRLRSKGPNLGLGRGDGYAGDHIWSVIANLPTRELPSKFERQVRKNARSDWKSFRFSNRYMAMMQEMADWADAREDRSLVFVIPPTIVEMQNTISVYGLASLDLSLRTKLAQMAAVIDFDFPNAKTTDLNNFSDAYHFNSKMARQIVAEILMVQGTEPQQAKTIAKRRSGVECPAEPLVQASMAAATATTHDYLQGNACRVWIGKTNG
ncbi:MAG: hypothetical protein ABJH63_20830 [Rhizobiaceae bacterium]